MDEHAGNGETTYVQVAGHVMFDGASLILLELAPATVVFKPSLDASVGYLPTGPFLDRWYAEGSGAGTRSVTAVLSLIDPDRTSSPDATVIISLPRIRGTGLEYQVRVVSGLIPEESGAAVLFINPIAALSTPATASGLITVRPS